MYKVFFNDRILFVHTCFTTTSSTLDNTVYIEDNESIAKAVSQFLHDKEKGNLNVCVKSDEEAWNFFKTFFILIEAAGGVVINENEKLLLIHRLGYWDLPKGKIDRGETARMAAIREVQEECGLTEIEIQKELEPTFHLYQSPYHNGKWILKKTYWYLMTTNSNAPLIPEEAENIEIAQWSTTIEALKIKKDTYPSLVPLLDFYLQNFYSR